MSKNQLNREWEIDTEIQQTVYTQKINKIYKSLVMLTNKIV